MIAQLITTIFGSFLKPNANRKEPENVDFEIHQNFSISRGLLGISKSIVFTLGL